MTIRGWRRVIGSQTRLANVVDQVHRKHGWKAVALTLLLSAILAVLVTALTSCCSHPPKNDVPAAVCRKGYAAVARDVFHYDWCTHLDRSDPSKVEYFTTREAALSSGRLPCSRCNP